MRAQWAVGLGVWLALAAPLAADDSPRARFDAIQTAQNEASERFHKEIQAAGTSIEAQQAVVDRYHALVEKHTAAALRLVREAPDDPTATLALKFVIKTNRAGPGPATAEALRIMVERRMFADKGQGNVLGYTALTLFQYPDAERYLAGVLDENGNHADQGAGCYWLARYYRQQARMARRLRANPEMQKDYKKHTAAMPIADFVNQADPEALERRAEGLLERALDKFGDVVLEGDKRALREFVGGELFAIRHLEIGRTAPEIKGTDADGKPFKLSETRGKVVVLTFSGNWCGPCVRMYPQERKLVERLKGQPFALVSVNTDKELDTLKASIARGDVTWRCWWDGSTEGPITNRWGVTGFPSIFVLDRSGTIRFKDVRDKDLDNAVTKLLAETKSKSGKGAIR